MSGTVYLLRHGSIEGCEVRKFVGQSDIPLDANGKKQAECWARRFAGKDFSTVLASDLTRCMDTARIASGGRAPLPVSKLREIDVGELEGLTVEYVQRTMPEAYEARGKDIAGYRPPGGESFGDLSRRVVPAFMDILREASGDVLVVAHSGVNRVILCSLLAMPLANLFRLGQDYGCLNLITGRRGDPLVQAVNISCDWTSLLGV